MSEVSLFRNFAQLTGHCSITAVLSEIQSGTYRASIEAIRKLMTENKTSEAENLKKQLPGFTPSGKFENGRKADRLTTYSGFVILDLDKLNPEQLIKAKATAANAPFTFAAFISPSGNGLKIIVPVTSSAEHHKTAFQQVAGYYEQALQLSVDPSGKDVSRLCFMSYDPECCINLDALHFNISIYEKPTPQKPNDNLLNEQPMNPKEEIYKDRYSKCKNFTERISTYQEGNRNNFIHLLACNCSRANIPESIAESYISQSFNLAFSEIQATVKSVYANTPKENTNITAPVSEQKFLGDTLENMILRAQNEPRPQFLWSGIMVGSFGFIFGPSKSGKTILCENLAMSIAAGRDSFFRLPIEFSGKKVLFISMEEYWQPRTQRNEKQLAHLNQPLGDYYQIVDENFPRIINTDEDWATIEKQIIFASAEVVFIDSLSRLYSGCIEESNTAKQVSLRLREMANRLKITLIVIHHTPKQIGKPLTIDSLAGSRILAQEADFLIGISKTHDGTRYMKEIAFRYKQENDETVITFVIDNNAWLVPTNEISEAALLREKDGRNDNTNTNLILDYIVEKSASSSGFAAAKELHETFVDSDIMSKPTLYSQLKKLQSNGKIFSPEKGIYKVKHTE